MVADYFYIVGEDQTVIDVRRKAYEAMSVVSIDGNNLHSRSDDSPSSIMHSIKGGTSKKLREMYPDSVESTWTQHFWADGYYVGTVGTRDLERVARYVRNQNKHYVKEPR